MIYEFLKKLFWIVENWLADLTFFGLLGKKSKYGKSETRRKKRLSSRRYHKLPTTDIESNGLKMAYGRGKLELIKKTGYTFLSRFEQV